MKLKSEKLSLVHTFEFGMQSTTLETSLLFSSIDMT